MTANGTLSRSASMAAAVARLAAESLVDGSAIEPEQSIMITWAVVGAVVGVAAGPEPVPAPDEVMVTTASTTVDPRGRYSFWYTSAVTALASVMASPPG